VFNPLRATRNFLWCEGTQRRSHKFGTLAELPTDLMLCGKTRGCAARLEAEQEQAIVAMRELIEQYRAEKMPVRCSTRKGYEAWMQPDRGAIP
jgi:hypothetical protein